MKFIHLSDLHLGKRVNDFSMLEDQAFILDQILSVIHTEQPDAVLIAGDVYDKSVPSAEAVSLFDSFLTKLSAAHFPVYLLSGNHDSAERLAFGSRLMDLSGVHIAPVYHGQVTPFTLQDDFDEVNVYMLPFVKPVHVRACFADKEINTWTDALRVAVQNMHVDPSKRNVLVAHQFVTGAERSDSEEVSVGGADNVDASVFSDFDYVALGHIHGPQNVQDPEAPADACLTDPGCVIRYCGSPLKYSFSEAKHQKSVTAVELGEKGDVQVRTVDLHPLRDMVEIKGTYEELMDRSFYEGTSYPQSYVHVTLTDEMDVVNALAKLRTVYPYLMKLDYDNRRTRSLGTDTLAADPKAISPLELFTRFFEMQRGTPLTKEQADYVQTVMENLQEDNFQE